MFTNVGNVTRRENFMYIKLVLIIIVITLTSSCTEFAMLSSGTTIAVSHNAYAKVYSGLDFLTIINTEKDIKMHAYDALTKGKND